MSVVVPCYFIFVTPCAADAQTYRVISVCRVSCDRWTEQRGMYTTRVHSCESLSQAATCEWMGMLAGTLAPPPGLWTVLHFVRFSRIPCLGSPLLDSASLSIRASVAHASRYHDGFTNQPTYNTYTIEYPSKAHYAT